MVKKQKIFLILYVVFLLLTIVSAIHSIVTRSNAGLSIILIIFGIIFANLYHNEKDKKK